MSWSGSDCGYDSDGGQCNYKGCSKDPGDLSGTYCQGCGDWYCGYHDGLGISGGKRLCCVCFKGAEGAEDTDTNEQKCGYRKCSKTTDDANDENRCAECETWYCDDHKIFTDKAGAQVCVFCQI